MSTIAIETDKPAADVQPETETGSKKPAK